MVRKGFWDAVVDEGVLSYVLGKIALPTLMTCFRASRFWEPASIRVSGSSEADLLRTWLSAADQTQLVKFGRWALGAYGKTFKYPYQLDIPCSSASSGFHIVNCSYRTDTNLYFKFRKVCYNTRYMQIMQHR